VAFSHMHIFSLTLTLLAVAAIGLYSTRKVKSAADFAVSGRSSGVVLISGTITGTIIGGTATIGTAQLAYSIGLSAWWYTLGSGIGFIIMGLFYARPLRQSALETIPQFLVHHYGEMAGPIASLISSIGIFFGIMASLLPAVTLITAIFNVSTFTAVCICIVLVVAYVFFGGVWGAGLAGILKLIIIYLTLAISGVIAWSAMGGLTGIVSTFPVFPWFSLIGRGGWLDVASLLSLVVGILSTQTYIQAIYAARDTQTARTGSLVAAAMTIPVGLPSVLVGMYMSLHYPSIAPIDALPLFIINNLPDWLGGLAIGGLILSTVGSAAGLALGIGTMISRDIVSGIFHYTNDCGLLWINRGFVLLIAFSAAFCAFGNMNSLVLEWGILSMSLRGSSIILPLSFAIFLPGKLSSRWAIYSMLLGAVIALLTKILYSGGLDPLFSSLLASMAVILVGVIKDAKKHTDILDQ